MSTVGNAALDLFAARERLSSLAEQQRHFGAKRELIDVDTLSQVVLLREQTASDAAIEERFHLKRGILARLGKRGMVKAIQLPSFSSSRD